MVDIASNASIICFEERIKIKTNNSKIKNSTFKQLLSYLQSKNITDNNFLFGLPYTSFKVKNYVLKAQTVYTLKVELITFRKLKLFNFHKVRQLLSSSKTKYEINL